MCSTYAAQPTPDHRRNAEKCGKRQGVDPDAPGRRDGETACVKDLRPCRPPAAEIELTIDLTADPIEGLLRHPHGADKPFAGWMALVRAMELALDDERRHHDS